MKSKVLNYIPLPTNRTKRSKLYKIEKSNILQKENVYYDEVNVNNSDKINKVKLRKRLMEKQFIN